MSWKRSKRTKLFGKYPIAVILATTPIIAAWTMTAAFFSCTQDKNLADVTPPKITLRQSETDVSGGRTVMLSDGELSIWDCVIASWTDDSGKPCKATLTFHSQVVNSWATIDDEGTLILTVTDQSGNSRSTEINLTINADHPDITIIQQEENVFGWTMVTVKDNLLIIWTDTVASWIGGYSNVSSVQLSFNWNEVKSGETLNKAGNLALIVTNEKGKTDIAEFTIIDIAEFTIISEYKNIKLNNIQPSEILPIIWQIERWDWYKPIEHLRIAESTRMRDMMRKYGAGSHSPEEYQQLMSRLHTGMLNELPYDYDNYEKIGNLEWREPSKHAYEEWNILNTLVDHASFQISYNNIKDLWELVKNNPNNIYIFWESSFATYTPNNYDFNKEWNGKALKDTWSDKNFIIRVAWSNIEEYENWEIINKICNRDTPPVQEWIIYWDCSRANSNKNSHPDRHILVTIWTNSEWNVDQTGETSYVSKFPVWFNDNVLFSWRTFPYRDYQSWRIGTDTYKYATSYTNYLNVAITDLCFQLFAEVENVDQLLDMIRSTSLRDYISLDWETQTLQLINPAWFIQKYLMPTNLPAVIEEDETLTLNKGYYKGVVFDIPGAEVNINGVWTTYNDTNKTAILSQNPFSIEWRLNSTLLRKLGYSSGDAVTGNVIVVDDEWHCLNMANDITFEIE